MKYEVLTIFTIITFFLTSCAPAAPVPTQTSIPIPTPMPTYTPTPLPTPSPTPIPWQKYRMTYLVKEGEYGKLWMPSPRTLENIGMRNVGIVDISPEPADIYQDVQGNQIIFWNKGSRDQEYRITFDIELSKIHYVVDPENIGEYKTSDLDYIRYTSPSSRVESNDSRIIELAQNIIGDETNPYHQANKIYEWIRSNIQGNGISGETAITTLERKSGACGGHSFLYIALLRSIGIPSRNIGGLHSMNPNTFQGGDFREGTFGIHIWTEIYFPNYGWVQSDSTHHKFLGIDELRVVMFRGEDILLEHGYPLEIIPWFHMPQINSLSDSDPRTQTAGDYLRLEVERLDE